MLESDLQNKNKGELEKIAGRSNLYLGAMSQWFAWGFSILLGLIVQPIYFRRLGDESYGLWGLAASFIGFYGIFDLGLSAAVSRFLGNAIGARDAKQLNQVASTGKCLLCGTSFLIVLFALLIMRPAQDILRIPEMYTMDFRILLVLTSVSLVLSLMMSVYSGALLASEDFIMISCIRTVANTIRSLGGLAMVLWGKGVVGLAAAAVIAGVLEQSSIYLRCRKRIPELRTRFTGFEAKTARALFSFGSMRLAASAAEVIRSKLDIMLVTRFAGLAQAGFYNIALTAFRYVFNAAVSASGVSWPRLNILYGSGNRCELQDFFLRSSHLIAAFTSLLAGVIIGLAPFLIRLWMGPGCEDSALVLRILVAGYFLDLATNPGIGSLYATARHKYFAFQSVVEAIASFACAYVLGIRFGMAGVAAGIGIPITIIKLTVQPWYVTRSLSINFWKYWIRTIAMPTLAVVLLSGGLGLLGYAYVRLGWWSVPVLAAASLSSCGAVLWRLVLDAEDRNRLVFNFKKIIGKTASLGSGLKVSSNPEVID